MHQPFYRYVWACGFLLLIAACSKKTSTEDHNSLQLGACKPVPTAGRLSFNSSSGIYTYTTSGGGKIEVNPLGYVKVSHHDYTGFVLELWGNMDPVNGVILSGNHENLNGKHIKDRFGKWRTIVFPDGAKFTMQTRAEVGQLLSFSIYDGTESHHINFDCSVLEYSGQSEAFAKQMDDAEPDGETSTFEISNTGLILDNIYREDTPGNRVNQRVKLGELFRASPNHVNDYFDDPRLAHT